MPKTGDAYAQIAEDMSKENAAKSAAIENPAADAAKIAEAARIEAENQAASAQTEADRIAAEAAKTNNAGADAAKIAEEAEAARIEAEKVATSSAATQKSFDDEFKERFKGKTVDEIEAELTPKEAKKYKNQIIEKLIELDGQGIDIDEDFIALQTKDFTSKSPEQLMLEDMKSKKEYKGWTDAELKMELDDIYKRDEWNLEEAERTDKEKLTRKRFERDAEAIRERLIEKQQTTSLKARD